MEGTTFSPSHYATEDNSYNADGQLTGVSITGIDSGASNAYSYDSDSQLTGSSGTSNITYGYDANGNHDTIGYTTGAGNEMTHSPGVTYTYDNDGNTITATTSSRTTTYTYDFESRLTNVEIDRTMSATYTYDALGRRIGIDDGGTQTWTAFNGKTADDNPYADFTASGSLQTRYLDGLAVDELFARTSASGVTAWYPRDNVGSFYADVTTTMVLDAVIYDPYGNIVTETNASEGDRFKFAGMEYDSVTGLYYDHARYYDAATGRFVNQDPVAFKGGDPNLYRYVRNRPTITTDDNGEGPIFGPIQLPPPTTTPNPPKPPDPAGPEPPLHLPPIQINPPYDPTKPPSTPPVSIPPPNSGPLPSKDPRPEAVALGRPPEGAVNVR